MSEVNTFGVRLRQASSQQSVSREVQEITEKGSVRKWLIGTLKQRVYILLHSVSLTREFRSACKVSSARDSPLPIRAFNKKPAQSNECKELEVNNQIVESNQE